jgi:3-hydroxybutyryl-CoA dehydratase
VIARIFKPSRPMNAETASTGYYFEDLAIGMSADFRRVIGDEEMRLFADLTGDTNPLHFDDDFAERSRFGGRIVHGMCTAALISTVIGTRLPGPGCIYLSQTLRFTAPVRPGDEIVARAVVDRLIPERRRVEFETTCSVGDQIVLAGRALAQVPSRTGPA